MKVTGECFCGNIRYEAEVEQKLVAICHCTSCQRHSGSAFGVVVGVKNEAFNLVSGKLKSYEVTTDTGSIRSRTFCPDCGTRIYAKTLGEGMRFWGLRVGTIDQRAELVPTIQAWCRSAQSWAIIDSLPKFEKQPSDKEIEQIVSGQ